MAIVRLKRSYYASLCWYALTELGLTGQEPNAQYRDWVQNIAVLGEAFGFKPPVAGGPMFELLYQIPAYLDPEDKEALNSVKACILAMIRTQSTRCAHENWSEKTETWGTWYDLNVDDSTRAVDLVEMFFDFLRERWDEYQNGYTQKLEDIPFEDEEKRVNAASIFSRWEKALGVRYPYQEFRMILCPESPSYASSVGPDAIVFGLRCGTEEILPAAIHEIGVRYSNLDYLKRYEETKAIINTDYVNLLRVIEAETCYQKMKVFPEIETDRFLSPSWEQLVEWRAERTFAFTHYYDHLAHVYDRVKTDGVL